MSLLTLPRHPADCPRGAPTSQANRYGRGRGGGSWVVGPLVRQSYFMPFEHKLKTMAMMARILLLPKSLTKMGGWRGV